MSGKKNPPKRGAPRHDSLHKTLKRGFRLLFLLAKSDDRGVTVYWLAEQLRCSVRTVNRYLVVLESSGVKLERSGMKGNAYRYRAKYIRTETLFQNGKPQEMLKIR